jgi:hypothetical protein
MFDPGGHNVRSARFSRTSPNSLRPPTGRVSPRSGSTRRSRVTQLSPTVTPIDASDLRPPSAARRCVPRVVPRQTVGNVHDIAHVNAHRRERSTVHVGRSSVCAEVRTSADGR